jgi:Ca2+-binding EF-hand superfamily protein
LPPSKLNIIFRFEQNLKTKLQQKCNAHQSEETFLLKSFKFFDFKNSGEVDYPTFQRAIAKIGVMVDDNDLQEFFSAYDSNGNGRIDYKEFTDIIFGKAVVQNQQQQ